MTRLVIDKGKKRHVPVAEGIPTVSRSTPHLEHGFIAKMSALQTFLLVVDHDKQEAKQIAERIAQGTVFSDLFAIKNMKMGCC